MALPITIPNTFANATTSIPLSQLDNNFSTVVVAINGIGNGAEALSNVNITGGNVTVTTVDATNLEVTNVKSKNGANAFVITDTTGNVNFDSGTLYIDAANNRVGIGTTTPGSGLDVRANSAVFLGPVGSEGGELQLSNAAGSVGGVIDVDSSNFVRIASANAGITMSANGTQRFVLATSGVTGINTGNPAGDFALTLGNSSGINAGLVALAGGAVSATIYTDGTSVLVGSRTNSPVLTLVNSAEKARFTTDAASYFRMASGTGGIQFNGDTAAANALDDYEEGSWTPVIKFGGPSGTTATITVSGSNNIYTKIGNFVYCNFQAKIDNLNGGSGAIDISGFPFSQAGPAYNYGYIQGDAGMGMPAGYASMMPYLTGGNSRLLRMNNSTHEDFAASDVAAVPIIFYGFFIYQV